MPETTVRECRHCGGPLDGKRGGAWFCTPACKKKAKRRRRAGRPENYLPGPAGGRRGRIPLSVVTPWERLVDEFARLEQAVQ